MFAYCACDYLVRFDGAAARLAGPWEAWCGYVANASRGGGFVVNAKLGGWGSQGCRAKRVLVAGGAGEDMARWGRGMGK